MSITIDGTNGISSTAITQIAKGGSAKGAVTRPMQSKAWDIISVKDYISETFNYASDATSGFAAAANSVNAGNFIEIFVPSGSYILSSVMTGITSYATFILADDAIITGTNASTFLTGAVANVKIKRNRVYTVASAPSAGAAEGIYKVGNVLYCSDGTTILQVGANISAMTDLIATTGTDTVQRTISAAQLKLGAQAAGISTFASSTNITALFNGVARVSDTNSLYIGDGTSLYNIPSKDPSGALILKNNTTQDSIVYGVEKFTDAAFLPQTVNVTGSTVGGSQLWTFDGVTGTAPEIATYTAPFSAGKYKITLFVTSITPSNAPLINSSVTSYFIINDKKHLLIDLGYDVSIPNTLQTFVVYVNITANDVATGYNNFIYTSSAYSVENLKFSAVPVTISRYPGLILQDSTGTGKLSISTDTNVGGTYIGYNSTSNIITGINNTAIGYNSSNKLLDGKNNTAIGNGSLSSIENGNNNTAIGYNTLYSYESVDSIAIGYKTMQNASGKSDIAIGTNALYNTNPTGSYGGTMIVPVNYNGNNVAIGTNALYGTTASIPYYNVAIGTSTLYSATTASNCVAIGYQAGKSITTSTNCVAIGANALSTYSLNASGSCIAIGINALLGFTGVSAGSCIGIGNTTLSGGTSFSNLTITTAGALYTDGYYPCVILNLVAAAPTGTSATVAYPRAEIVVYGGIIIYAKLIYGGDGWNSGATSLIFGVTSLLGAGNGLLRLTLGGVNGNCYSIAIGDFSSQRVSNLGVTTQGNTIIGHSTQQYALVSSYNTSLGYSSMKGAASSATANNFTQSNNTAIGAKSLLAMLKASNNTAIGFNSLSALTSGINNTSIGAANSILTSGNDNISLGGYVSVAYASTNASVIIGNYIGGYTVSPKTNLRFGASGSSSQNNTIIIADGIGRVGLFVDNSSSIYTNGNMYVGEALVSSYIDMTNKIILGASIPTQTNKYGETLSTNMLFPQFNWNINGGAVDNTGVYYNALLSNFSALTEGQVVTFGCSVTGTVDGDAKTAVSQITIPLLIEGATLVANAFVTNEMQTCQSTSLAAATNAYYSTYLAIGSMNSSNVTAYVGTTQCTYAASGNNTFTCTSVVTGMTQAAGVGSGSVFQITQPSAFTAETATNVVTITVINGSGVTLTPITRTITYNITRPSTQKGNSAIINMGFGRSSFSTPFFAFKNTAGNLTFGTSYASQMLPTSVRNVISVTPVASTTYTYDSAPAGTIITLIVNTLGTASFTLTFGGNFKATATLVTGTVTAKVYTMQFVSNGTNLIEISRTAAI